MEYIHDKCKAVYTPEKHLSLDGGMLKWKGRLNIRTYNPKKPTKYGIKFYFLCEMPLAEELYSRGTHVSGTLCVTRRGAPTVLRNCSKYNSLPRGAMYWHRKDNTFVISWQDIRCVTFITTAENAATESFIHNQRIKRGGRYMLEEHQLLRPKALGDYIAYMGGVDLFDQMMNYYTFARRSRRWTKKTILYLLQLALYNSYILYQSCLSFRKYHELIASAFLYFDPAMWPDSGNKIPYAPGILVEERFDRLPPHPSPPAVDDPIYPEAILAVSPPDPTHPFGTKPDHPHRLIPSDTMTVQGVKIIHKHEKIGRARQQRKCRVCSMNGIRRDTVYQCSHCKIALCQVTGQCLTKYHTLSQYWTPGRRREGPGPGVYNTHRGPYLQDSSKEDRILESKRTLRTQDIR
ncbi:piggyBac transposable element-derived protein 4-like [Palaemon carinicauda]|uniref:piggyBac transposable element-derived protein 4-like n=1 Tax=Palaemon carinicauda TaxID=392227 RepID=UPI0035B5C93D